MGTKVKIGTFVSGLIGIFIIAALVFSFIGCGEKPVREYYANGQLKSERFYRHGKQHGLSKEYYENGQLESETSYKNGKINGRAKEYSESGKLWKDEAYKDGELRSDQLMKERMKKEGFSFMEDDGSDAANKAKGPAKQLDPSNNEPTMLVYLEGPGAIVQVPANMTDDEVRGLKGLSAIEFENLVKKDEKK